MVSFFARVNRLFTSKLSANPSLYKQKQALLVLRLKQASDLRTRQLILDKMMAEDLLRAADLSHTALHDIHLESANLEEADLCGAALPEADLEGANLQHADLSDADLKSADLMNAKLCAAELSHIHLDGATLAKADLSAADLQYACLRDASLYAAQLKDAQLDYADLRGCCLMYADLDGASFHGTLFDETTVLPNGEQWTPKVNMQRFTDDSHADYLSYREPGSAISQETTSAE